MLRKLIHTDHSRTTLLIRFMVGAVFLSEGIQKFLYPDQLGPGRFEKMGFPDPGFFGCFVGSFELVCGLFILGGLLTRIAALAMTVNMLVAIIVTKIPIGLGESFGPFVLRDLDRYGFWSMAHEMRTDFAMLLGSFFLLIKGGGGRSADRLIQEAKM